MTNILRDIWVLGNDGVCIFKRVFDEKVDSQLFAGFMSALLSFASQITDKGMNGFELGEKHFFIGRQNNLIFVVNCDKKIKRNDALKELEKIMKKFFNRYSMEILTKWDGNTDFFVQFKEDIDESLESPVKILRDALW